MFTGLGAALGGAWSWFSGSKTGRYVVYAVVILVGLLFGRRSIIKGAQKDLILKQHKDATRRIRKARHAAEKERTDNRDRSHSELAERVRDKGL